MSIEKYRTMSDAKLQMLLSAKAVTEEKKVLLRQVVAERAQSDSEPSPTVEPTVQPAPVAVVTPPPAVPVQQVAPPAPPVVSAPPAQPVAPAEQPKSIAEIMANTPQQQAPPPAPTPVVEEEPAHTPAVAPSPPAPVVPVAEVSTPTQPTVVPPTVQKPAAYVSTNTIPSTDPFEYGLNTQVTIPVPKKHKETLGETTVGTIIGKRLIIEYSVETSAGKITVRNRSMQEHNPR